MPFFSVSSSNFAENRMVMQIVSMFCLKLTTETGSKVNEFLIKELV